MNRRLLSRSLAVLLALATILGTFAAPVGAAKVDPELTEKLQGKLDQWRVNHHAPGVAAAVRFPDGSRWLGVSGRSVVGRNSRDLKKYTPLAVGSLTKTFVAATVLQLREERRLWLGTTIDRWLPDYPKADKITVKMLLSHRSGIFDYFDHPKYEKKVFGRPWKYWKTSEILALTGPRVCKPGKCFHYSNTNYVLLGKIVRKVTGRSVATEIRRRFLKPLGLDDTFFQGKEAIGRVPAKGYWWTGGGYKGFSDGTLYRPNRSAATVAGAAGAMLSSVRDISDWQNALLSGDVLEPSSLDLMLTFQNGYGLGMRRARLDDRPAIGHGGSLRGYVSLMYRLPDEDLDVVVLTNLGRSNIQGLADKLTRVALTHLEATP